MDIYLDLHLFIYPSISPSIHNRTYALEKLTNRKRRLPLYYEGKSQRLTMELASLVFFQFQHGGKMANTLWLRGGLTIDLRVCRELKMNNYSRNCLKLCLWRLLCLSTPKLFFQIKSIFIFYFKFY